MFIIERDLNMLIVESRLRRVIRGILLEVSRKYVYDDYDYDDDIDMSDYETFKKYHSYEVESLINSIANRIYNEQTGGNAKALETEYEQMCLDADLGMFADEIINDAYERHNDPY